VAKVVAANSRTVRCHCVAKFKWRLVTADRGFCRRAGANWLLPDGMGVKSSAIGRLEHGEPEEVGDLAKLWQVLRYRVPPPVDESRPALRAGMAEPS